MNDNTLDTDVQALCKAGEINAATTLIIEHYGPGVLGMLWKMLSDPDQAGDVFSMWCEDVWGGLENFSWRSSFKTWSYRLAINALSRYRRVPRYKRGRLLETNEMAQVVAQVRESTLVFQRTEVKDRFHAIRQQLSDEDNTLLILRIDRKMAWKEIARVMLDTQQRDPDAKALARESNRLRQHFYRVTHKLKKLAQEEGLLDPNPE